jgi:hypothetical protein
MMFIIGNIGIAGNNDFHLNVWESLGDDGGRHRLLVFAHNGYKGFVLLAYCSIDAFSPSKIVGQFSPDIQGFLWVWGSGCSDM